MPGQGPPERHFQNRVLRYLPRVILNLLMSVAVMVLERRIRKALRSKAQSGRQSGH